MVGFEGWFRGQKIGGCLLALCVFVYSQMRSLQGSKKTYFDEIKS